MEGHGHSLDELYLLGFPVKHSVGPAMYEAVFKRLGIEAVYRVLEVPPEALGGAVEVLRRRRCRGFNVTIPHKTRVVEHLDLLEPPASTIGAVNTVVIEDGRLVGYNTDVHGFREALLRFTGPRRWGRAVLVGAGGAARAAAYALRDLVEELVIVSRTGRTAEALARDAEAWGVPHATGHAASPRIYRRVLREASLVVNASPVGMEPRSDETPIPAELLQPGTVVFDMVYRPLKTRLLRGAEKAGCTVIDGLWMLASQAAENMRLWYGVHVGVGEFRKAALEAMGMGNHE